MKRIFSFVLSALLAVVFTTAHAQQNIFIWKGGNISVKSAANIDSITTSVSSWLCIRTSTATSVTTDMLEASICVSYADNVPSLSQTLEVGVCFSSEKTTPTYADEHIYLGTSGRSYNFTLYELDPGTTYYYRGYVKLGDEVISYGNVKSIMTFCKKPTSPTDIIINGHKFVDLGLPNGLLWARTNIGAASSLDNGDYFAWGETEPKYDYFPENYKWVDANYGMTKYYYYDHKTLDPNDDAATFNWGVPCRMPDSSEFQELYNKCDWSWKSNCNGTSGYIVTGPNGNTIFFPDNGSEGYYWSRSVYESDFAFCLDISSGYINPVRYRRRYLGFTVRPVAEK